MKYIMTCIITVFLMLGATVPLRAGEKSVPETERSEDIDKLVQEILDRHKEKDQEVEETGEYLVGVNDILEISVLEPEEITRVVNVAPDGTITFPYIGNVMVKGYAIRKIQKSITAMLADGFLKYPVVLVSLQESRSKQYLVYGEVVKPGAYPLQEYSTVLRAISQAGGFTKFGSSSRVKVLRPKQGRAGYETIKIDIKDVMNGDAEEDIPLKAGDMVVVSEGVF